MSEEYMSTNPYAILGVRNNAPYSEVREAFKGKILQHHPDKGGDPAYFKVLQEAYKFILKKHKQKNQYREKIEREVREQKYKPNLEERDVGGLENIHVSSKNFNANKFNKMFDQFRLKDPNMERGYTDNDFQPEDLGSLDFQGRKVGQEEFNRRFAMQKKKHTQDMVVYKEPEPLWSMENHNKLGKNFSLLGEDEVGDFSNKTSNLEFTDYKKAYETKMINPDEINVKQYNNVDQLKSDRENVPFEMSEEEKRFQLMKQQEEAEREERRQGRLREMDEMTERNFNEINRRLITR